jgi:integrase
LELAAGGGGHGDASPAAAGPVEAARSPWRVGIPAAIVPDLERHLAVYVKPDPGALVFPGIMGGPIRRGNFNKLSGWPHAVEALGLAGLHFHDLRHTGNQFAANSRAGLRDLMARMGHDSERAAMIYQHEARGADKAITDAIDKHVDDEHRQDDDEDDGPAGARVPA